MSAFEIGFVPQGWIRGQLLNVVMPRHGSPEGQVWRLPPAAWFTTGPVPNDIACVTFRAGDIPRLEAWLAWWRGA